MKPVTVTPRRGRGRPPKFGRAARSVTLTLPEDVLARLGALDSDIGRAVVGLVERAVRTGPRRRAPAELATYGTRAVILVTPVRALRKLKGVQLVPVGHNRALIALAGAHAIPRLELEVRDALDSGSVPVRERGALTGIAGILRDARASGSRSVSERTIIVLETRRRRAP